MTTHREAAPHDVAHELHRYRLIDVREPAERVGELGHIEGSENLPLGRLEAEVERLLGEDPILFICRSGGRSAKACSIVAAHVNVEVVNLTGGMIAWNEAGLAVVGASAEEAGAGEESGPR